ncbi:MAG: hypothetical protein IPK60_05190 [Sandaracinaceae bacterium]|nr:hypothetical protein [Sandaracinaceae bacterium]
MRCDALCAILLVLVSSACGRVRYLSGESLEVQVVTGLVPGAEFTRVETAVLVRDDSTQSLVAVDSREASARFGQDYAHGQRVGVFSRLPGDYLVRVVLRRPSGAILATQLTAVSFESAYVLRVHITRDCAGVQCPGGGDASLLACLNGQCVDPKCDAAHRSFCPALQFCNDASDCAAVSACATLSCDDGLCAQVPSEDACAANEWCDPRPGSGCTAIVDMPPESIQCGTICAATAATCRASYWNCEGPIPACQPLFSLAPGTVCGVASVCDVIGSCVSCNEGAACSAGCARGTINCSTGAPVCAPTVPAVHSPPGTPCLDVGSCEDAMPCTTNGVCDADAVCRLGSGLPAVIISPTTGVSTSEMGGMAMLTLRLAAQPEADVVIMASSIMPSEGLVAPGMITFTHATWNDPQSVTVTGVDDSIADGNVMYAIRFGVASSDTAYALVTVPDVSVLNIDDETPSITVTPTSGLTTTEGGGTATFQIVLNTEPTANVRVDFESTDAAEGSVSPAFVTFTPLTWSLAQTITVTGVNDFVADGDRAYLVATNAATSTDPNYDGFDASDVALTNGDDDMPGISVTPTSGLVTTEGGGTDTFSVVLNSQPTADVVIPLSTSNAQEGAATVASLTFTPVDWNVAQTVTVEGVNDDVADLDVMYAIVTAAAVSTDTLYSGRSANDVTITNLDNDVAGIAVSPTSGLVTTEAGATATFTIVLTSEPVADVTVALASSNSSEGTVSPASVTFTALSWDTPQTVTLTGVNDFILDPSVAYDVTTAPAISTDPNYSARDASDVMALNQTSLALQGYFKASNTDVNDHFFTVALSYDGNTMVVGAPGEASNATGVGGDQTNNSITNSGAVYVFSRSAGIWSQEAYIKASNPGMGDYFGAFLSFSADGNTLAVGDWYEDSASAGINGNQADNSSMDAGAAFIFTRSGSIWSQQAYIKSSNPGALDGFSFGLWLSGDGDTLAVGAQSEDSSATGVNGNELDNSLFNAGAVYIFVRSAGVWSQQAYLKAAVSGTPDVFGHAVALSHDGNTLGVSAYNEAGAATGINGDQTSNAAAGSGAAYIFTRAASVWSQQAYIKASNTGASDRFALSIALSADGDTFAAGAYLEDSNATGIGGDGTNNLAADSGAEYVFTRSAGVWSQQAYIKASNAEAGDYFGYATALSADGNTLLVNAFREASAATGLFGDQSSNAATLSGAVYAFTRAGAAWTQQAYIKASNTNASDALGGSCGIAISGDGRTIAIGATGEASNATGIGGDQTNDAAAGSGAVYVYAGL